MASQRNPPTERIRLARSLPRVLAWPALVAGTGVLAATTWLMGSFGTGVGGMVFAALGGVLVLIGLAMAGILLSVRLEVEEAAIRLRWIGGERVYVLARGPVTRVRLRGTDASSLRPRFGMFGWALGGARLRDEEDIHVVRLARTPTAILVPTERGRLAIAAADEDALLDALSRAARARQRLEELFESAPAGESTDPSPATPAEAADVHPQVDAEPRVLTGIERALLERRLAEERSAAEAAPEEVEGGVPAQGPGRVDVAVPPTVGTGMRARIRQRPVALGRPRPAAAFVLLPLVAAGAAWAIGLLAGTYPEPGTDAGRLTALALVLAGPASSIGAVMALAWWPRIVGVVVGGGLAASVFIGRALLG
ncbi:MAG: hypothetical protein KY392_02965 [Chloroflexi bacterium]|nr:hypothetical protein [Chloroflexota bacterium]